MFKKMFCFAILIAFTSCATIPPQTSSGNVELQISNVSADCVRDEFIQQMISRGWMLSREDPHVLVFSKTESNPVASIIFGSRFNPTPERRATLTIMASSPIRVVVVEEIVTNPGTGFEHKTRIPQTQKNQSDFQSWILLLSAKCEKN